MALDIDMARARLVDAYDPRHMKESLLTLATPLSAYAGDVRQKAMPGTIQQMIVDAASSLNTARKAPGNVSLSTLVTDYLSRANHIHAPTYMGHQVPPPPPVAAVAHALMGYTNQGLAVFEMAPYGTAIERVLIKQLCEKVGWDSRLADGIVTSGGTLANLTAVLAARQHAASHSWDEGTASLAQPLVVFCSKDAHYSVGRAMGISGLGARHLYGVRLGSAGGMDPVALEQGVLEAMARGEKPCCVIASAPSTPLGHIDPLMAVADVCARYKLWMHVDAVHGAGFLFSDKYRHVLAGIERADSVAWDAHKMMHVPSLCTFLLYKNKSHSFLPFKQAASYLFSDSDDDSEAFADGGLRSIECTKPALSLPLWFVWHAFGDQFFADLVDVTMDLTQSCYEALGRSAHFVAAAPPQTNILAFKFREKRAEGNPWLRQLRLRLIRETSYYITGTDIDGDYHFRVTLINPLTTVAHFQGLLDSLWGLAQD